MQHKEQTIKGYTAVAEAYSKKFNDELSHKPFDRMVLKRFAECTTGKCVLDVGCGPGQITQFIADLGGKVVGLDFCPEMIEQAKALHPTVTFEVGMCIFSL